MEWLINISDKYGEVNYQLSSYIHDNLISDLIKLVKIPERQISLIELSVLIDDVKMYKHLLKLGFGIPFLDLILISCQTKSYNILQYSLHNRYYITTLS